MPALSSGLQGLGQRAGRVQGLGVQGLVDQGLDRGPGLKRFSGFLG